MTKNTHEQFVLVGILIVSGILPLSTLVDQFTGYVMVMITYVFVGLAFLKNYSTIYSSRVPALLIGLPIIVFLGHMFLPPYHTSSLISLIPFTIVPLCNLYIVPQLIPTKRFLWLLSRIAAFVAILGIFSYFLNDISIFGVSLSTYSSAAYSPFWTDDTVSPIKSIFRNPNPFSIFVAAGATATLVEIYKKRTTTSVVIFSFCTIGLYLSGSRGGLVGFLAGLLVVVLYISLSNKRFCYAVIFMITGFVVGSLALIGVFPNPTNINLTGRDIIWSGALEAAQQQILLGYGLVDLRFVIEPYISHPRFSGLPTHNSYIQILLSSGIIGLCGYIGFVLWCLLKSLHSDDGIYAVGILGIAVGLSVSQMFETYSLFGLSGLSIITSIAYGYLLQQATQDIVVSNIENR